MRLTLVAFNIMPRTTVAKINLKILVGFGQFFNHNCFVDQNNPNVTVQRAHFEGFFTIQSITLELINGKLKKGFPMLPDFQCTWWLLGKHSFFSKVLEQLGGANYQISYFFLILSSQFLISKKMLGLSTFSVTTTGAFKFITLERVTSRHWQLLLPTEVGALHPQTYRSFHQCS